MGSCLAAWIPLILRVAGYLQTQSFRRISLRQEAGEALSGTDKAVRKYITSVLSLTAGVNLRDFSSIS